MSVLKNRISAVVAGSAVLVAVGATSAVAGNLVGSAGIRDGGVHRVDLGKGINAWIDNMATDDQVNGLAGRVTELENDSESSATDVEALQTRITDLEALVARVDKLEGDSANGSDVNTNWVAGPGATIPAGNTVVLDSTNTPDDPSTPWDDSHTSYASIANLDLPIGAGSEIEFTYKLENGAAFGWGAPRVQIRVNGVTYSSAHQINPAAGNDNDDGTFTVTAVATSMNDNSAHEVPEGTVTRAVLAYDNQPAPGTVTITNLVIDGHPISFQ
ncbi:MAG TPA: hypothetical protein VFI99_08785 [Nocardioides sp.]|jgi:hypothetical protein|nr:hypothetical protein [Nocardioides sp.]